MIIKDLQHQEHIRVQEPVLELKIGQIPEFT